MTELAKRERTELAGYGQNEDIREMAQRLTQMLPNAKQLGATGALALAQVAIALDLNPLTGEVWAIPQQGGTFAIMAGIKGLRRAARVQAEAGGGTYYVDQRLATDEETQGTTLAKGDIARACDVYVLTEKTLALAEITGKPVMFTGLGIFRGKEKSRMEPVMVARKRAEADGLKQAFDLAALTDYEPEPPTEWDLSMQERDVALPVDYRPQRGNDLYKVTGRRPRINAWQDPLEPTEDDLEEEMNHNAARFAFYDEVIRTMPYYDTRQKVADALTTIGFAYDGGHEEDLYVALGDHACRKVHEEAAAEEKKPAEAMI